MFDLKPGILEIEKQSGFQARDVEIAKHLGDVGFVEIGNHFRIDDDGLVYNQVGEEGANELTVVLNGILFLLFADKTFLGEFDDQCALVELFIKTGLQFIEHAHGSTDDDFREFFVVVKHVFYRNSFTKRFPPRMARNDTDVKNGGGVKLLADCLGGMDDRFPARIQERIWSCRL